MRRSFIAIFLAMLSSVLIPENVLSQQQATDPQASVAMVSSLRWFMQSARKVLEAQVDLSWNYRQQVNLLAGKLAEIDSKLEQIQECSPITAYSPDRTQSASLGELDNETRINILGGQALLGYKAQLLQKELAKLTQGNENKLGAFENAMVKAEELSEQVMKLRFIIRQKMEPTDLEPNSRIAENTLFLPEGQKRSGPVKYLSQNISEERAAPTMFLKAAAGASDVKSGPAKAVGAESEAKYAVADLKRKIDEVAKQSKALQQLVSEIIQKTELIKKQEKQTDSKLADMRQLTKNWEGRKIPVNEEVMTLEKKLNGDMIIYQEALKEVDMLRQFLTSMFSGTFVQESGTHK
ncbi:MAG: hypothetical protein V1897_20055 [Pseudomonadota bacterium]